MRDMHISAASSTRPTDDQGPDELAIMRTALTRSGSFRARSNELRGPSSTGTPTYHVQSKVHGWDCSC